MDEQKIREIIREELAFMVKSKKLVFPYPMQILDGNDILLGQAHGTRIGTTATQKLGFFGATPAVQQAAIPTPAGGATIDSYARARIDDIRAVLYTFGFTAP